MAAALPDALPTADLPIAQYRAAVHAPIVCLHRPAALLAAAATRPAHLTAPAVAVARLTAAAVAAVAHHTVVVAAAAEEASAVVAQAAAVAAVALVADADNNG